MTPELATWFDARDALLACWSRGPFDADLTAIAKYRRQIDESEAAMHRMARLTNRPFLATATPDDVVRWIRWTSAEAARGPWTPVQATEWAADSRGRFP